jgi:hypothetical protein
VSYRARVALDSLYARRKSLVLDGWILLATIPAVRAAAGPTETPGRPPVKSVTRHAYFNARAWRCRRAAPKAGGWSVTSAGNETITSGAGDISLSGEGAATSDRSVRRQPHLHHQPAGPGAGSRRRRCRHDIGWLSLKLAPNVENLVVHMDFNYAVGNDLGNLIVVDGSQW